MTSIKVKFRQSKISKKKGTCFVQLIHNLKFAANPFARTNLIVTRA